MATFLTIWLPLWACSLGFLSYHVLIGNGPTEYIVTLLACEITCLLSWALYRTVLYPSYLTPLRHLPTPSGRTFLYGNRKQFFPDLWWDDIRAAVNALPNNGLIRFYEILGNEMLIVTKVEGVKEMMTLRPYDFGHPILDMLNWITCSDFGFFTRDGHKLFRKHLRPAFAPSYVKNIMPMIWIKSNDTVRRIEDDLRHKPDAVFDIFDYTRHLMWDISELITLGPNSHIDSQVRERLSTFLLEPSGSMLVVWFRLLLCNVGFWPLISSITPLFTMTYVGGWLNYVRKFVRRCVTDRERRSAEHKAAEGGDLDITSFSMATGAFSTGELVENDMLYTLAATKSIAVAFEWAMFELGQHQDAQERLRAEINASATPGHGEDFGAKLQSLPYLTAVCNEVFRLHPFVPLTPMLAEKNTTLLGEPIPKDTVILVPVEHFNRNAEIWGANSNEFNPERWLCVESKMDNYAMLTFGAGPNGCIGQHYARGALMCLVASFVRRLEVTLVNVETAGRLEAAIYKKSEEGVKVGFWMMET